MGAVKNTTRCNGRYLLILLLASGALGCSTDSSVGVGYKGNSKPVVYAVNYPLAFFAKQIGGELVDIVFPVPGDRDPADWVPEPEVIERMQSADLILLSGGGHAKWTESVSLPLSRLVDTTREVAEQYIKVDHAITHSHGPAGDHSHAAVATETWLDPNLAIAQARVIMEEFNGLVPASSPQFQANFDNLHNELNELDGELQSLLTQSTTPGLASHPVYEYFARRYSLKLQSMHWEPNVFPADEDWRALEAMLRQQRPRFMLWEDNPIDATNKRLHELDVKVVVFRTLSSKPTRGDYLNAMRENIQNLKNALTE